MAETEILLLDLERGLVVAKIVWSCTGQMMNVNTT